MALKQVEPTVKKVGEYNFYIRPFAAFKAANLTGELASVLAPLLSGAGSSCRSWRKSYGRCAGKAAEAMSNCTAIDGDKLERLTKKLLLGGHIAVEVTGDDGETEGQILDENLINEMFCGEVQDMFMLCFHVIQLNFNGFFKRFAGLSGKGKSAAKKTPRKIL